MQLVVCKQTTPSTITGLLGCDVFKDYSKMSRIPSNPVKSLVICDFEDQYWDEVRKQKQGARCALYTVPVSILLHVLMTVCM